jgi:membrane protein DedA with SNARE-associated domain
VQTDLHVEHRVIAWLGEHGAPVLFLAQLFGIFGLPIPDELLLTTAGVLVRKGQMQVLPTLAAAIAGSSAGITVSYVLGRTVGLATLQRVMHVHESSLARGQRWFRRFGGWLLTFGFYIPGIRHVTAIAAGSMPLEFVTFAKYAYPGAALWSFCFVGLGYFAGSRWAELLAAVRGKIVIGAIALAAILLAYMLLSRRRITTE